MIKSGLLLGTGNLTVALLSLVRNILIARLISVEDFGIASALAITMSLVEMTSSIALDRLIVQAPDGAGPELQKSAQMIQSARGALAGLVLFLIANPAAALFGVPHAAWAFQVLAIVPVMRGVAHFDMFRMQREMKFGPSITVEFASQGVSTAIALPLAIWLGDYRAMLYSLMAQQLVYTAVSYMVAERPYRWGWDMAIVRRAISFGWPLLINNILLFCLFNGDMIIVGNQIGTTELGWFSAIFNLILIATLVIAKTLQSFFLPLLSEAQDEDDTFERLAIVTVQVGMLAGVVLTVMLAIIGPTMFIFLYGAKYEPALSVMVWLGIMQAVRVAKAGPTIIAIAKAKTRIPLIANIVRIMMLPVAWLAVKNGSGIETLVGLAIVGESLSFATSVFLLWKWVPLRVAALTLSIATCIATLTWAGADNFLFFSGAGNLRSEQVLLVGAALVVLWSMPALRAWLKTLFQAR